MVETDQVGSGENTGSVWYTPEGAAAAESGVLAAWIGPDSDPDRSLSLWLASPFHGVALLDPDLRQTGWGGWVDADSPKVAAAATLDVDRGVVAGAHRRFPTSWPGDGATVPLTDLAAESPDPLTSCDGYKRPVGQPIYAFFSERPQEVSTYLVRESDGRALAYCTISGSTYENPSAVLTYVGRTELADRNAVVIIPRSPMVDGETYTYRVRADGELAEGTFTVGPLSFDPFTDVRAGHQFIDEITWLSSMGVSTGYRDGSFGPTTAVSRQALVAFMWRLSGEPTTVTDPGFPDVTTGNPFREAIAWGVAEGLLEGFEDGEFHPIEPVSRQAAMAFLWRLEGSPAVGGSSGFSDVPADSPFRDAIAWGVSAGVTDGFTDGGFHPTEPVSRQAAAAFLYGLQNG